MTACELFAQIDYCLNCLANTSANAQVCSVLKCILYDCIKKEMHSQKLYHAMSPYELTIAKFVVLDACRYDTMMNIMIGKMHHLVKKLDLNIEIMIPIWESM